VTRTWLAVAAMVLTGCGVTPTGVTDGGEAPTGVAPGVTLYFVDARDELVPRPRETGRLGTVAEAVSLLLLGPGGSDLRTEIAPTTNPQVVVTTTPGMLRLRVPLAAREVTPVGIDQIVCTALGVHVQSSGSPGTRVRIDFTLPAPGSDTPRTCPLTG
jgi:hypothetical protein